MESQMPDRIEAAVANLTTALNDLKVTWHGRTEHFKRILYGIVVASALQLVSLLIIISAIHPGIPVLRIYEHNAAQTARFVQSINESHQQILNRLPPTTTTTIP
jgi:hypothetical protein